MRFSRALALLAAVSAALIGSTAAAATAPARTFPTAATPFLGDAYPERRTAFPGGVTGLADVTYQSLTGFRPAIVDIYLPPGAGPAKRAPLVLYVHGGGWIGGHTRQSGAFSDFPKVLASLAKEGFVVASLEYRLAAEAPFPAQLQDARAALRFLKANAAKYGIDPARTAIWGGSAGGHLAALTALSCGDHSFDAAPAPAGSECVQAAATWYGVFDFAPLLARQATQASGAAAPENLLLRCSPQTCTPEAVRQVSPASYIDASDPPFLLVHGEQDRTVPVEQSRLAEARLKAAGVQVETLYLPDIDHSFIGKSPEATRAASLKAINATFDFFHKTLGVPGR